MHLKPCINNSFPLCLFTNITGLLDDTNEHIDIVRKLLVLFYYEL